MPTAGSVAPAQDMAHEQATLHETPTSKQLSSWHADCFVTATCPDMAVDTWSLAVSWAVDKCRLLAWTKGAKTRTMVIKTGTRAFLFMGDILRASNKSCIDPDQTGSPGKSRRRIHRTSGAFKSANQIRCIALVQVSDRPTRRASGASLSRACIPAS